MTNKQEISEIVGHTRGADGSSDAVYRALRPLLCASCGRPVAEGEMFTRRKLPGVYLRILPQCTNCVPLKLHTTDRGTRSALIEALLSPAPEKPPPQTPVTAKATTDDAAQRGARRAEAEREVQRRIGPALNRRRR